MLLPLVPDNKTFCVLLGGEEECLMRLPFLGGLWLRVLGSCSAEVDQTSSEPGGRRLESRLSVQGERERRE